MVFSELSRRGLKRRAAQVGKPRLDHAIGEGCIDLLVQFLDDFRGGVLGRADAVPLGCLMVGQKSPTVGMFGNASERVAVVTASARSLPTLIYSMDEAGLRK
jgi:hypothetical protein